MISHAAARNRLRRTARRWIRTAAGLALTTVLLAATAEGATVTRGPYLQLLGTTDVTVVWNTDVPAGCSLGVRALDGTPWTVAGGTGSVCAMRVDGLSPGTTYAYVPRADGVDLRAESVFRTDAPDRRFSFLVFGDSGSGGPPQYAVAARMLASPADFALHTGDMIYESGAAPDFDPKFFAPYAEMVRQLVLWPCLGNHDMETAAGQPWRDAFYTPANNPTGSENYYSFDYGSAHVVVLDSNASTSPGSAQYDFLDRDLAASPQAWRFVAFHHTVYSSGSHGGNLTIRANLGPLFDAHAVDVVFMGHDHDYERTETLRADQVVAPGEGTVYVTTGGGGESLRPVGTSTFTAYAESAYHFTRVSVDGAGLLLQMIRADGSIGDSLTLLRGTAPAVRCGDDLVNQAGEVCDGLDHTACVGGCDADCTCLPVCGDGQQNDAAEACDGGADAACPGLCRADCLCGTPSEFLTLAPVADTYVEGGTEATWDHGASGHLDVDRKPPGIAYLKFDLSGVPAAVEHATLTLACTNTSVDGGSIYPVGSSSWIEGDRTGADSTSARGPGLKWTDVDTNGDGEIDANDTSPWVPDWRSGVAWLGPVTAGREVSADVTGAVRGGPGLYSLAIRNDSSDGATYGSRQSATPSQRPRLRLQLGSAIPPGTSSTTTSTTAPPSSTIGTSTTASTSTTSTTIPPPTGAVQADTFVRERSPRANFGTATALEVSGRSGKRENAFLRVSVQGVAGRTVSSARLRLRVTSSSGSAPGGRIHAISSCAWSELGVTWSTQPAIDGSVLARVVDVPSGAVADFDVTAAIPGDGVYCFAIDGTGNGVVGYASREAATPPTVVLQVTP